MRSAARALMTAAGRPPHQWRPWLPRRSAALLLALLGGLLEHVRHVQTAQ